MRVSVLLLTFNEEQNLSRCLNSLAWCDDIAIVDSGSTDGTVEIARRRNVRVICRPFDNFAAQRNFGLEAAGLRHDWVLHLDADESATEPFAQKLQSLTPSPGIDAYEVPAKFIVFDRWLRHASMYPVYQVRLARIGVRFRQVGHGQREDLTRDRVGRFDEPYLHYVLSRGVLDWFARHVRYAGAEAEELVRFRQESEFRVRDLVSQDSTVRRRAGKALTYWCPLFFRAPLRFLYVYFARRGLLDGSAGFAYANMMMVYEAMIAVRAYELLGAPSQGVKTRIPHRREKVAADT